MQSQTPKPLVDNSSRNRGRYRVEVDNSIYGTVNGGGPDFELRTFNGDIYLRRGINKLDRTARRHIQAHVAIASRALGAGCVRANAGSFSTAAVAKAHSEPPVHQPHAVVLAVRTSTRPTIDGHISDEAWSLATPATTFTAAGFG